MGDCKLQQDQMLDLSLLSTLHSVNINKRKPNVLLFTHNIHTVHLKSLYVSEKF